MMTPRNGVIAGGVAVLAVAGAVWTQAREADSPCSDIFFTELVHEEMRGKFLEDSQVLAALVAGADPENEFVNEESRARYALAADELRTAVMETEVVGRMKHPNNQDLKTCYLSLAFSDVFSDDSLVQNSGLPLISGPDFEVIARFDIKFQNVSGVQLEGNLEASRNQWLIGRIEGGDVVEVQIARGQVVDSSVQGGELIEGPIPAGTAVEAARTALLTRRDFTLEEPEFVDLDYSVAFTPSEAIEDGFFGNR